MYSNTLVLSLHLEEKKKLKKMANTHH